MFDDVDGGAIAVVDLFVAEGPHMMDEVPKLTLRQDHHLELERRERIE